jgi:hypothetical protein
MGDRTRRASVAMTGALLLATLLSGCGGKPGGEAETPVAAGASSEVTPEAPIETTPPVEATVAPTPTATPSRTPTAKPKAKPKPKPKPNVEIAKDLPPAVPNPAPSDCKPRYAGTQATRAEAKQALTAAAGRTYWPVSAPSIRVPLDLVKAVAWQESGWQSNIISCDNGVGLMQVMAPTAKYVNDRFEQSYDLNKYQDNATLGTNYLAWLIKYFGDVYFDGDYALSTSGDCASSTDLCLMNAVIASYNYGFGKVGLDDGLVIPNPQYVRNVRALMTECECLSF